MAYEITVKYIKENRSYKKLDAIGMTIHDTGNVWGDTDENNWSYFNRAYRAASAHIFIDDDSITQFIPLNERAWHAGPTANARFIGVEMCNSKTGKKGFDIIYAKTVWIFAKIFIEELHIHTITKKNLMSHHEITKKWGETDHVDPDSYLAKYGKSVDIFRKDVQLEINKQLKEIENKPVLKVLSKGDKGKEVYTVQALLNKYGFELVMDGSYGTRTEDAVKKFQKDNGLPVDGKMRKETLEALKGNGFFKDEKEIPEWALEGAKWARQTGIVFGMVKETLCQTKL
jgi:N-acetylmuramoyl-L-alanine amidase CwlA